MRKQKKYVKLNNAKKPNFGRFDNFKAWWL